MKTTLLSLLAARLAFSFEFILYTDTACQNVLTDFAGDRSDDSNAYNNTVLPVNAYLGAVREISDDKWTGAFNYYLTDDGGVCVFNDEQCCEGAPTCLYAGSGRGNPDQDCLVVDKTVENVAALSYNCEEVCIDNDY